MRRLFLLLLLGSSLAQAQTVLRVGVLLVRSPEHTERDWQSTFDQLQRALPELRFEVRADDYDHLEARLEAGELDLLVTNPEHYLLQRHRGLTVLATVMPWTAGHPSNRFAGVIFTRADSTVRTLADVARASTAGTSEKAIGSFLLQRWELLKVGLDVTPRIDFVGQAQDEVVQRVLDGRAQVGFVRTGVLEEMASEGAVDLSAVRIINPRTDEGFFPVHSTELVPEWPVLATSRVSEATAAQLTRALLEVSPASASASARAGRSFGFVPAADYSSVEALMLRIQRPLTRPFGLLDVLRKYAIGVAAVLAVLLATTLTVVVRLLRDQRRLELAAQEKTQLLASLGEGVMGVDLAGLVTYVNDAALQQLRYRREEMIGHSLHQLVHHHYRDGRPFPESECHMFEVLAAGKGRSGEESLFRADGSVLPVWRSIVPVMQGTTVVGAVISFVDQTAQLAGEAELKRARDVAEAANAAKSRFLATMSHEIRTPLNGVLGMAQLLGEPNLGEADRLDYARTILESGSSLMSILNDILDLAKVEAGRLELSAVRMSPAHLVSEMPGLFGHVARLKGVTLTTRFLGDPQACVRGDAVRVRQMMANLLGNATKFTDQGSIELMVSLSPEGLLRCEVRDTGPGIPAELVGRLFTPFMQVDSSDTRPRGGTGLGLSIVRELAEAMHGASGVSSVVGEGSCFWFTAQLEPCSREEEARLETGASPLVLPVPRRVLVVDDNPINRRVVDGLLKKLGCSSVSVENGARALEELAKDPAFDLVLMDCQMPEMDGYEATRVLRSREAQLGLRHLPVIALTAAAFEDDRRRCLDAGMDEVLTKPVMLSKLATVLSDARLQRPHLID